MAEKTKDAKEEKKPSEPTERVIIAGFWMETERVAKALVEAGYGQTTESVGPGNDDRRQKLIEDTAKKLGATAGETETGEVVVYVEVGVGRDGDKRKAIEAVVGEGTLGIYRAPSRKAWKDGIRKKPPATVAPDVERLD